LLQSKKRPKNISFKESDANCQLETRHWAADDPIKKILKTFSQWFKNCWWPRSICREKYFNKSKSQMCSIWITSHTSITYRYYYKPSQKISLQSFLCYIKWLWYRSRFWQFESFEFLWIHIRKMVPTIKNRENDKYKIG
jgi:hypothetical protein